MQNSKSPVEVYTENDKIFSPWLLACSFKGLLKYEGSFTQSDILFLQFSPKEKALELIDQLQTKTEPHIPAKDIFEAIDTFWNQVAKSKKRNGGMQHGEKNW